MFDDIVNNNDMAMINKEPTWHRPGRRRSLLDLYTVDNSHLITKTENVTNILSEHSGVTIDIILSLKTAKKQFLMMRNCKNVNQENLEPLIKNNEDLNTLFNEEDPDTITEKLLRGLNNVLKELVPKTGYNSPKT